MLTSSIAMNFEALFIIFAYEVGGFLVTEMRNSSLQTFSSRVEGNARHMTSFVAPAYNIAALYALICASGSVVPSYLSKGPGILSLGISTLIMSSRPKFLHHPFELLLHLLPCFVLFFFVLFVLLLMIRSLVVCYLLLLSSSGGLVDRPIFSLLLVDVVILCASVSFVVEYQSRSPTVDANWGAEDAKVAVMCWWSAGVANRVTWVVRTVTGRVERRWWREVGCVLCNDAPSEAYPEVQNHTPIRCIVYLPQLAQSA
ncbi:uncharacterized protein G2W53_033497 [Senna tora]|uniref:Uncharacterized protein n=1 Tax=Senna tora TaxID=362788 RepID=A0A834T1E8_9FABA|nr:uncharacterized protein G2W53_033497 [Senna tora]